MTISLAQNAARVSYSVSEGATQTSFTVSFEFFDDADLNVYVDGTKKTLTTHYSVSGGSGSTGAVAISVTGATGGSTVVITRDIALARTTDFPTSGSFQISTLNTELDRFTAIAADLKDSVDRSLQLTDFDSAVSLVLPAVADRKGKVLAFNASTGAVEAGASVSAVQSVADNAAAVNLLGTAAVVEDMGLLSATAVIEDMGLLATAAIIEDMGLLATSAVIEDMGLLATSAVIEDMGLLGTSANITAMGLLGNSTVITNMSNLSASAVIADMAILGTTDVVADMAILGTSDVVSDMNTLATSDIVSDMNTLATSANVTAMGLLGNSTTVTNMGLLGTSAAVADMALLGTSDVVADMALLATSDVISDMNTLATSDIISDLNTLATSDIVTDMNLLATSSNVAAMALLGTSDVVADMALLGTSDVVADLAILGTTDVVSDMNTLATSDIVSDMNTLATSANVTAMGLLGTSAVVEDMGFLGTAAVVEDMGILGTSANVTAMSNVSGSISNVNTVATNLSGITAFSEVYSSGSSDPSSNLNAGDLFFNTSSDTLKVYTGSAWEQGVTAGSGFFPLSGGTITGNLVAGDNVKATFGDGSDLQIYHDGSNSYIAEGGDGTGSLRLQANNLLAYSNSDEPYFQGVSNGTFRIYYDGSTKLATTATGVDVTGNIVVSGTVDGVDLQTLNTAVTANTAKTTNATHTGEVTGSGALTIADNVVDEANLKVSNSPVNGYMLTAQSGNTGGLTWAEAGGGTPAIVFPSNWASPTNNYTSSGTWSKGSLADDDYVWFYLVNSGGGGGNQRPGFGGMAMLLYGTAAAFNGASYTIGAEKAGQNDNHGTIQNPTTVTLSSSNGSLAFTPKEISDADDTSGVSTLQTNIRSIHAGVADAYLIGSPAASYSIKTGTLPTNYGKWTVSNGYQTYDNYDGDCVFGGGVGYTTIGSANASAVSLFAGNGGSSLGAAPAAPGGGGAQGNGTTGATGAAGSLRVYHV